MLWHKAVYETTDGMSWLVVSPASGSTFVKTMLWTSRAHDWFSVSSWGLNTVVISGFWIDELFTTEVQPNIESCGR